MAVEVSDSIRTTNTMTATSPQTRHRGASDDPIQRNRNISQQQQKPRAQSHVPSRQHDNSTKDISETEKNIQDMNEHDEEIRSRRGSSVSTTSTQRSSIWRRTSFILGKLVPGKRRIKKRAETFSSSQSHPPPESRRRYKSEGDWPIEEKHEEDEHDELVQHYKRQESQASESTIETNPLDTTTGTPVKQTPEGDDTQGQVQTRSESVEAAQERAQTPPTVNTTPDQAQDTPVNFVLLDTEQPHTAEPEDLDEIAESVRLEVHKYSKLVNERKDEFISKVDAIEEKEDELVQRCVEQLALAVGQTTSQATVDTTRTSLTPAQIALLYATLQCSETAVEKPKPRVYHRTRPRAQARHPSFTLPSEGLILSHAHQAASAAAPETGCMDNWVEPLHNRHDERVYPQVCSAKKVKEAYWFQSATKIQATLRGMRDRELVRQRVKNRRVDTRATPLAVLHHPNHFNTSAYKAKETGQLAMESHRNVAPNEQNQLVLVDETKYEEQTARKRVIEMEPITLEQHNMVPELPPPSMGLSMQYDISHSDEELLVQFYETFRAANLPQPLTISRLVSSLRRCRSHLQKTEFDRTANRVIKGLLRLQTDQYKMLQPLDFLQIVFEARQSVETRELGDDILELAYAFEKLSTTATPTLQEPKQQHGLTPHEVRLLRRLFFYVTRNHHELDSEDSVNAHWFVNNIETKAKLRRENALQLYEYVATHGNGILTVTDFVRFADQQAVHNNEIAVKLLALATEVDEKQKTRKAGAQLRSRTKTEPTALETDEKSRPGQYAHRDYTTHLPGSKPFDSLRYKARKITEQYLQST